MAEAVIVGALAPGVNRPTWTAFRNVMISLSVVLAVQLAIAVQWSSNELLLHVCCLTALAATLFLLLKWFVSETGLVTVQQQMDELGALNSKAQ